MEHCSHVWYGVSSCYLELLGKLQKQICRTVGPSLTASLEPFTYHQNVASLSLFCSYYFGACLSELAQLVTIFFFSRERSTCYSDRLHDFLLPFLNVTRMYMSIFSFSWTARIWNSLSIESFPLTCDLNGFKSRTNRHLLTVGSFSADFLYALTFLYFSSCTSIPCGGCLALHRVTPN